MYEDPKQDTNVITLIPFSKNEVNEVRVSLRITNLSVNRSEIPVYGDVNRSNREIFKIAIHLILSYTE